MKLSIVSYLDPHSSAIVRSLQEELSGITHSKASLSSWQPHVTIGDGIELDDNELHELKTNLANIARETKQFSLNLSDVGSMDNWKGGKDEEVTPYVIYLDVEVTDSLTSLVNQAAEISNRHTKWYIMPKPYLPHVTLAFRDLPKEGFHKGLHYLRGQDIEISATIDHVALVEKLPNLDRELVRYRFNKSS